MGDDEVESFFGNNNRGDIALTKDNNEDHKNCDEEEEEEVDADNVSTDERKAKIHGDMKEGREWQELMGNDLVLKVHGSSRQGDDNISSVGAEYRDSVFLQLKGRVLGPDDKFTSTTKKGDKNKGGDDEAGESGRAGSGNKALIKNVLLDRNTNDAPLFINNDNVLATLGEGDVPPGIELALRYLPPGHRGTVRCLSKYAYGKDGRFCSPLKTGETNRRTKGEESTEGSDDSSDRFAYEEVPPNHAVEFELMVNRVIRADTFTPAFDLDRARRKKDMGNDWFFRGNYVTALRFYSSAARVASSVTEREQQQKREQDDNCSSSSSPLNDECKTGDGKSNEGLGLVVDCHNNAALCQLKLREYSKAKESCTEVLKIDPQNIKALCRAARAATDMGSYAEAFIILKEMKQIKGGKDDADVRKIERYLRQSKEEYKKEKKELYVRMMKEQRGGRQDAGCDDVTKSFAQGQGHRQMFIILAIAFVFALILVICWACWTTKRSREMAVNTDATLAKQMESIMAGEEF